MDTKRITPQPVYLIPSIRRGNGLGHLIRCAETVERMADARLLLLNPGGEDVFSLDEIETALKGRGMTGRIIEELPAAEEREISGGGEDSLPLLVLDQRTTPESLFRDLGGRGFLLGLDEGGAWRGSFHFLADTLPGPGGLTPPNISSPLLLTGPGQVRKPPEKIASVLITFGGEDPAGLTSKAVENLLEGLSASEEKAPDLTICLGPLFLNREEELEEKFPGVNFLRSPEALRELLHRYDLVITSFGLTAFEAVRAGVPVLLMNPSSYHEELGRRTGFSSLRKESVPELLREPASLNRQVDAWLGDHSDEVSELTGAGGSGLPELFASLVCTPPRCPGCGCRAESGGTELLERFPRRTYYQCGNCSLVYQNLHSPPDEDYGEEYFFEGYKRQYGKTYLEDFPNLRRMAGERLDIIQALLHPRRKSAGSPDPPDHEGSVLLEIGCAYGPFLLEASERGFTPLGIDVSTGGVAYARENLGFEAAEVSMEAFNLKESFGLERAEVIALWYVIEHFPDLKAVLEKIAGCQTPGGLLAFSTPNCRGISGRKNRRAFLDASPMDHYQIWNPGIARKVLKLYGYRVRRIRVTGHHPERFPGCGEKRGLKFRFFMIVSRIFGLGDTFEVYAQKIRPAEDE